MAKDKVKVPSIKISNQRPGIAFGGVIYSADVSVGYNAEPTKLNINVVLDTKISKKRDFLISKSDLDLTSPVDIKIADESMFKNMFLHSYDISTGVSSKQLHLTYIDGSALLDRIFVGLIHEHFQVHSKKHMVPNVVAFDVRCPTIELVKVEDTVMPVCADQGTTLHKGLQTYKYLASPTGIPGRPYAVYKQNKRVIWEGGYIVLGREEFSEVSCDIRDVSYGFEDLLNALESKGFGWGIKIDKSRYTVTKDSNLLLRSYTGTVKDVLQNWGNDLKISYYWDFTRKDPTLAIISNADRSVDVKVEKAAADIERLDIGQNGSSGTGGTATDFIINSKNESFTLDGTLSQAYSSIFTAGPKATTTNKRKTSDVFFNCQTIHDISASGNMSGRHPRDVKISLGLGKYSKDLRDIWNARKAIAVTSTKPELGGGLANAMGYFRAIGFQDIIPVTFKAAQGEGVDWRIREYIIGMCGLTQMFSNQAGKQNDDDFMKDMNNPGGYEIFIGLYDETLKNLHTSIESEIESGFIGRHYVLGAPKSEAFEGNNYYKMSMKTETKPSSTYYSLNQHYKTPLAKFAKKIQDLRLNRLAENEDAYINRLYDETNKMRFDILDECSQKDKDKSFYRDSMKKGFYHFEREAHWATFQEDIDNLINPNELQLRSWLDSSGIPGAKPGTLMYDIGTAEYQKDRVRTSMLKEYIPFNAEIPMILQFIQKMPTKMQTMLSAGEASDKKVVVCMVRTGIADQMIGVPGMGGTTTIGDNKSGSIKIIPDFKTYVNPSYSSTVETTGGCRNPIEEINALRSLCDRTSSAKSDAISKFKTKCERDFTDELCSSRNFGQEDKTCGEAESLKDSLYSLELEPDVRLVNPGEPHEGQGIYADRIRLIRHNPDVNIKFTPNPKDPSDPTADTGGVFTTMPLFQDIRDVAYATDVNGNPKYDRSVVDIIYPSENIHNGMLIYDTETTITDLSVRKVLDPINLSRVKINKRASSVQYQTKDITQDVTSVINDDTQARIDKGETPTDIVADVDNIQKKDGNQEYLSLQTLTAEKYHERLRGNINDIQIEEPRKSYSFKIYVAGVGALASLIAILKPENGLESLSINIDEAGFSISVNLSNRASADVALREIFNKTGPLARETSKKFSTLRST